MRCGWEGGVQVRQGTRNETGKQKCQNTLLVMQESGQSGLREIRKREGTNQRYISKGRSDGKDMMGGQELKQKTRSEGRTQFSLLRARGCFQGEFPNPEASYVLWARAEISLRIQPAQNPCKTADKFLFVCLSYSFICDCFFFLVCFFYCNVSFMKTMTVVSPCLVQCQGHS